MDDSTDIMWPSEFAPTRAPVHVANRLTSAAAPEAVWAWLVRASGWPHWYPNSHRVRIEGGKLELEPAARFAWSTFGVSLVSQVEEFVPGKRIAWNARGLGVWAYHAWLIEPRGTGCLIVTEETQYGVLARLGHFFAPQRMSRGHQMWLERLDAKALAGPPADS
ncbi:MAG: SRPBCC domain-containing protein [Myxococcales bacterium]